MNTEPTYSSEILKIMSVYASTDIVISEAEKAYNSGNNDKYQKLKKYLDKKLCSQS